jgi:hypothetical protein
MHRRRNGMLDRITHQTANPGFSGNKYLIHIQP